VQPQAQGHCADAGAKALCDHKRKSNVQGQVQEQCAGAGAKALCRGRRKSTVRPQAQQHCAGAGAGAVCRRRQVQEHSAGAGARAMRGCGHTHVHWAWLQWSQGAHTTLRNTERTVLSPALSPMVRGAFAHDTITSCALGPSTPPYCHQEGADGLTHASSVPWWPAVPAPQFHHLLRPQALQHPAGREWAPEAGRLWPVSETV